MVMMLMVMMLMVMMTVAVGRSGGVHDLGVV